VTRRITPDHVYRDILGALECLVTDRRGSRDDLDEGNLIIGMMNTIAGMRDKDIERDEQATLARLKAKYETTDPEEDG
jgi:hypothetical protein